MREPQAQPQCAGDTVVGFRQIQTAIIDRVATQFMTIRQSARQKHPFGMGNAGKRRGQNRITDRRARSLDGWPKRGRKSSSPLGASGQFDCG